MSLGDFLRKTGGDPFNLSGSDEYDPIQKLLGGKEAIEDVGRGVGTLPTSLEKAKREALRKGEEDLKRITLEDANYRASESESLRGARALRGGISNRLSTLREGRSESVAARAQPALQQVAETAGAARRSIGMEGSRASFERAQVGTDKALANQQIQAQALGEQMNIEGGVQQLETELTGFFNELAANRFSREISGLTEEMNKWLSEQGAKIGYDQLAAEARQSSLEMMGRFTAALGTEMSRKDKTTDDYSGADSGRVTSMPSVFNMETP